MDSTKKMTVCFSGYRPEKIQQIGGNENAVIEQIKESLRGAVIAAVDEGYTHFISGMAPGFDVWAYDAVVSIRDWRGDAITLEAALPFEKQLSPTNRELQKVILDYADKVTITSDGYHKGVYHIRNRYMVDKSGLLICYYDGKKGGTEFTVEYAKEQGLQIINIADMLH